MLLPGVQTLVSKFSSFTDCSDRRSETWACTLAWGFWEETLWKWKVCWTCWFYLILDFENQTLGIYSTWHFLEELLLILAILSGITLRVQCQVHSLERLHIDLWLIVYRSRQIGMVSMIKCTSHLLPITFLTVIMLRSGNHHMNCTQTERNAKQ